MSSLYPSSSGGNRRNRPRWWNPFDAPDYDVEGSNIFGRAVSGLVQLPDTLLRGVANIGKSAYQDLDMSLHRGLRAANLPHSETIASRSAQGPELIGEIGRSLGNTATLVGRDLAVLPNLIEGARTGQGPGLALERLQERGQEFSADPSMFALEHVGNVAITGAIAAKPAQLGLARSRGALTTGEAAQGLRPLAGRESRAVARNLTSLEAQAARESGRIFSVPQAIHFTDNAINHPYITAGRRLRDSVPGRLVRHPLERAEAQARLSAMFRGERGELNFRREDPRRRWNEIQDELGSVDSYLEGEQSPNRVALQNELAELELEFRSRGIDIPQDGGPPGSGISGRFDPSDASPRDLTSTPDFAWMEDTPGLTSDDFVESTIRPTVNALENQGITPEPNTIGRVTEGNITDIYATGPDGQVIGVMSIDPDMGINIGVLPQFQRQGIGSSLARYAWENDIPGLQQAANNSTFSDMGSGLANRALEEIDAFTPTEQIRGKPTDIDSPITADTLELHRSGRYAGESDSYVFHGTTRAAAQEAQLPGVGGLHEGGFTPSLREALDYAGDNGVVVAIRRDSLPENIRGARATEQFRTGEAHLEQGNQWLDTPGGALIDEPVPFREVLTREQASSILDDLDSGTRQSALDELRDISRADEGTQPATDATNLPGASVRQAELFNELAEAQRARPEQAMLDYQRTASGGELSWLLEHVGDLTHRMSKRYGPGDYGRGDVLSKLRGARSTLGNENLPRFIDENLQGTHRYLTETQGETRPFAQWRAEEINPRLEAYADAHRELPVYNETQRLARDAAVAIGEQRFQDAHRMVTQLDELAQNPDAWRQRVAEFNDPTPSSPRSIFGDETGAVFPEGTGSVAEGRQARVQRRLDRLAQLESREFTIGPVDYLANEAGLAGRAVRESPLFQQRFGQEARLARVIGQDLQRSMSEGTGEIAERASQVSEVIGNQELRRRYDPSRVERMFLRDLDSLARRPDAERYAALVNELPVDRPGLATLPGRVGEVVSGQRVVGQTLSPQQLLARVETVLKHARDISARDGSAGAMTRTLQDMLPGVEPMGLYLMALDAADLMRGQPQGTLSSALGDFVTMDRFADLNRQAQLAMRNTEWSNVAAPDRFRLPENMLDVDINALPQNVRDIFHGAAEQYRRELAGTREPTLINQEVIQPGGTRAGLAANEPTQFPTKLEDLPLTQEARREISAAQKAMEDQANVTAKVEERLRELENSGRPMRVRDPSVRLTYRQGRPTQASFNRAWRTTPTGAAVKRWRERLGTEREKLLAARSRLEELERAAVIDPSNAPAAARNLLTYANEVAPTQARILRQMAQDSLGDPTTLRALADELDAMPKTIRDLNSAEVYVAYLRDVKGKRPDGSYGPGSGRRIDTRDPGGARRRRSDILDVEFDRDFRTRAYWQDSEFQNWFMKREADQWVVRSGLARTGNKRLLDAGFSSEDIARMSKRQKQQNLEQLGFRAYDADSLFGVSRKPTPPGVDPLQAEWIAPHVWDLLNKSMEGPGWWEKRLGQGIYDPLLQQWKVFALPLRFAWQVNNYFGNATLTMLAGKVSPLDYPKLMNASQRAVRNWNQGIVSEIEIPIHGAYRVELTNKLNTVEPGSVQARMIENMLEEGVIRIDNSVLNDISSRGITRGDFAWLNNSQFLRDLGAGNQNIFRQLGIEPRFLPDELSRRGGNIRQTGREVVDMAYHLNETVDNFHRAMVYMDQIGKGASHTQALAQVQKALGDYAKLNQFERRVVKRIYPFYPWMQHVARVVASSLHPSNIQRTVITSHMLNVLGQPNEWEELLPDWAGGHVYVGDTEDGTPRFFSTRGLNPFLDVFDPVSQPNMSGLLRPATPPLQFMYEQISGTSVLTNRPFSSPRGASAGDRPPVSEYFFRNIPQAGAGRDVYRELMGQPLTRWGTGEPGFFPGADQRSGYSSVVRLLGANIQPLDVESMSRQEKIREYQQEVAQRRQERLEARHGGRRARDLLDNLPLVGN